MRIFAAISLLVPGGEAAIPPPIHPLYAVAAAECGAQAWKGRPGRLSLERGVDAVRRLDLNADGKPDFILDYSALRCDAALSLFCGTGGCGYAIAFSTPKGYRRERFEGRGLTVMGARFPTLVFAVHGGECGREGAYDCHQLWRWNGHAMARVRR